MYHAPVSVGAFQGLSDPDLIALITTILDRIDAVDPCIHAFLPEPDRRRRVLTELEELCRRYPDPASRPGLFGVPIGVKDIFRTEGFETRAGSRLPPEVFAGAEGPAVSRLKAAGALVLGKTVTTEFAYFQPGPTRSPWNSQHTPGGSSSGSAAAVSAGFCPLALGSQTIGSINRPASFCGIAGFKPSYGRIPMEGIVPFAPSADHAGILAADIPSIRACAEAQVLPWRRNNPTPSFDKAVVILPEDSYSAQASEEARRAVEEAAKILSAAGHVIKRRSVFQHIEELNQAHTQMTAREFADTHEGFYSRYHHLYSARSKELFEDGTRVDDAEYKKALAGRLRVRIRIHELLKSEGAAALLTPSSHAAAPRGLESTGSPLLNLPWTYAGVPTVTLPAAVTPEGLPLGIQLVGNYNLDEELLAFAAHVEKQLRS